MKFRVSLSPDQVKWILSCPECPADLKKQLRVHLIKIEEGLITPAYEIKPRQVKDISIEQKYKLACKYLEQDQPIPEELADAYSEYRYLNDLMSDEERETYEQEALGGM